jgi:hypothetical protein
MGINRDIKPAPLPNNGFKLLHTELNAKQRVKCVHLKRATLVSQEVGNEKSYNDFVSHLCLENCKGGVLVFKEASGRNPGPPNPSYDFHSELGGPQSWSALGGVGKIFC